MNFDEMLTRRLRAAFTSEANDTNQNEDNDDRQDSDDQEED